MIKFNKVFNLRIISSILACVFLLTNIAYGIDLPERRLLRVPMGNYDRMNRVLNASTVNSIFPSNADEPLALQMIGRHVILTTNYSPSEYFPWNINEGDTVLDLGCGTGVHSIYAGLFGAKVIGIDAQQLKIGFAKRLLKYSGNRHIQKLLIEGNIEKINYMLRRLKDAPEEEDEIIDEPLSNVAFILTSAAQIPLESNTVDKIVFIDVIKYLPQESQIEAIKEILRVAKVGALVHIKPDAKATAKMLEFLRSIAKLEGVSIGEETYTNIGGLVIKVTGKQSISADSEGLSSQITPEETSGAIRPQDINLAAGRQQKIPHGRVNDFVRDNLPQDLRESPQNIRNYKQVEGYGAKARAIPIRGLFSATGQFAHIGLGRVYEEAVIYIDADYAENQIVLMHELYEIAKWEAKREELRLNPQEMRQWILDNLEEAKRLAEQWHNEAPRLDILFFAASRRMQGLLDFLAEAAGLSGHIAFEVEKTGPSYAFVNLDGKVHIAEGLFDLVQKGTITDGEFAAILAHEIAHLVADDVLLRILGLENPEEKDLELARWIQAAEILTKAGLSYKDMISFAKKVKAGVLVDLVAQMHLDFGEKHTTPDQLINAILKHQIWPVQTMDIRFMEAFLEDHLDYYGEDRDLNLGAGGKGFGIGASHGPIFPIIPNLPAQPTSTDINRIINNLSEVRSILRNQRNKKVNGNMEVQDNLVRIHGQGEAIFIGDIHGDPGAIAEILQRTNFIQRANNGENVYLVFLGDYIDRATSPVEQFKALEAILNLKKNFQDKIVLLRGNHDVGEDRVSPYTFTSDVQKYYGQERVSEIVKAFFDLCKELPFVAVTDAGDFAVHGGIVKERVITLNDIANAPESEAYQKNSILSDLMRTDPDVKAGGRGSATRFYTKKDVEVFLRTNNLRRIIRSHQAVKDGMEDVYADGRVINIFSNNAHYRNNVGKVGYLVSKVQSEKVEPPARQQVPASSAAPVPRIAPVPAQQPRSEITVSQARTFAELYAALDALGGLQGAKKYYTSAVLRRLIESLRQGRETDIDIITSTSGLRGKVRELLNAEAARKARIQQAKDELAEITTGLTKLTGVEAEKSKVSELEKRLQKLQEQYADIAEEIAQGIEASQQLLSGAREHIRQDIARIAHEEAIRAAEAKQAEASRPVATPVVVDLPKGEPYSINYSGPITIILPGRGILTVYSYKDIPDNALKRSLVPSIGYFIVQEGDYHYLEDFNDGKVVEIGRGIPGRFSLNDNRISRRHVKIERRGSTIILTDLNSTNGTRIKYVQNGSSGNASGALKQIGDEDTEEVPEETKEAWRDKADLQGEAETKEIKGVTITAKFITDDENMPQGMSAYHLYDSKGNFIIVTRSGLEPNIIDEAIYHEAREAYWIHELIARAGPEISEEQIKEISRQAHILAAAEESLAFGQEGLTPYHQSQLESMNPSQLQAIIDENREYQHKIIKDNLGEKMLAKVQEYEVRLKTAAEVKRDERAQITPPDVDQLFGNEEFQRKLEDIIEASTIFGVESGFALQGDNKFGEVKIGFQNVMRDIKSKYGNTQFHPLTHPAVVVFLPGESDLLYLNSGAPVILVWGDEIYGFFATVIVMKDGVLDLFTEGGRTYNDLITELDALNAIRFFRLNSTETKRFAFEEISSDKAKKAYTVLQEGLELIRNAAVERTYRIYKGKPLEEIDEAIERCRLDLSAIEETLNKESLVLADYVKEGYEKETRSLKYRLQGLEKARVEDFRDRMNAGVTTHMTLIFGESAPERDDERRFRAMAHRNIECAIDNVLPVVNPNGNDLTVYYPAAGFDIAIVLASTDATTLVYTDLTRDFMEQGRIDNFAAIIKEIESVKGEIISQYIPPLGREGRCEIKFKLPSKDGKLKERTLIYYSGVDAGEFIPQEIDNGYDVLWVANSDMFMSLPQIHEKLFRLIKENGFAIFGNGGASESEEYRTAEQMFSYVPGLQFDERWRFIDINESQEGFILGKKNSKAVNALGAMPDDNAHNRELILSFPQRNIFRSSI